MNNEADPLQRETGVMEQSRITPALLAVIALVAVGGVLKIGQ